MRGPAGRDGAHFSGVVGTRQHAGGGSAAAAAEHRRHHGRRHRHLEHRRLSPRHDGGTHAEPRQDRRRGHAVHRLLRRGKLHGGARQLHHRRAADPHRHDDRRPGRRADRPAGRGRHHRDRAQGHGLRHRPVRQEPPRRQERVPADGARLRRVLRLPLSPRRDGGPLPSELPSGSQGAGRPAQHGPLAGRPRSTMRRSIRAGARSASRRSRMRASSARSAWRPWTTKSATSR